MSRLPLKARLLARTIFPNRSWFPVEAWDDERYHKAFARMKTTREQLEVQYAAAHAGAFEGGPCFSIIVPLYRTSREYLNDVANSVLAQTYPNFELVLVNASPEIRELDEHVAMLARADERVKVVKLQGNLGITENSNRGIDQAKGDFVCFLDHDDWIEPDALFEYAMAIIDNPEIDLLYCDEDNVIRENGQWQHRYPFFKPDFSPEHLLCKNYIIHFLTVRKSIVDAMARPCAEFDGSQDYNMTLYASEHARCVHHVPKVLYHWRMSEASTADNPAAKPYAKTSNRLALWRHLVRTKANGRIFSAGIPRIHNVWFSVDGSEKVSLIVAALNGKAGDFANAFVQANSYGNCEVVLVRPAGAAPAHGLPEREPGADPCPFIQLEAQPGASLVSMLAEGAEQASGDILIFMDDTCAFASAEPIEQLVGFHRRDGLGIAAPRVLYADCSVKSYGVGVTGQAVMPLYRCYERTYPSYHCSTRAFQNASAAGWQGLSVKRALFEDAGGFDEALAPELSAADLCQRVIRSGSRLVVACTVELLTQEFPPERRYDPAANRPDYPQDDIDRFYAKWPDLRDACDPYLSPNLDQLTGYPTINPEYLE